MAGRGAPPPGAGRGAGLGAGQPPANYIAGLGRGATGFTTRSDIGPSRQAALEPAVRHRCRARHAAPLLQRDAALAARARRLTDTTRLRGSWGARRQPRAAAARSARGCVQGGR